MGSIHSSERHCSCDKKEKKKHVAKSAEAAQRRNVRPEQCCAILPGGTVARRATLCQYQGQARLSLALARRSLNHWHSNVTPKETIPRSLSVLRPRMTCLPGNHQSVPPWANNPCRPAISRLKYPMRGAIPQPAYSNNDSCRHHISSHPRILLHLLRSPW